VHPYNNAPLSVSHLTWSHATLVATVQEYLAKRPGLVLCPMCGQPIQWAGVSSGHQSHHADPGPGGGSRRKQTMLPVSDVERTSERKWAEEV
jgi:hypothetical protein